MGGGFASAGAPPASATAAGGALASATLLPAFSPLAATAGPGLITGGALPSVAAGATGAPASLPRGGLPGAGLPAWSFGGSEATSPAVAPSASPALLASAALGVPAVGAASASFSAF